MKYLVMLLLMLAGPAMAKETGFEYVVFLRGGEIHSDTRLEEPYKDCDEVHETIAVQISKVWTHDKILEHYLAFVCYSPLGVRNVVQADTMAMMVWTIHMLGGVE